MAVVDRQLCRLVAQPEGRLLVAICHRDQVQAVKSTGLQIDRLALGGHDVRSPGPCRRQLELNAVIGKFGGEYLGRKRITLGVEPGLGFVPVGAADRQIVGERRGRNGVNDVTSFSPVTGAGLTGSTAPLTSCAEATAPANPICTAGAALPSVSTSRTITSSPVCAFFRARTRRRPLLTLSMEKVSAEGITPAVQVKDSTPESDDHGVRAIGRAEFTKYVLNVDFDCSDRGPEVFANLFIAQSLSNEPKHFDFAWRKRKPRKMLAQALCYLCLHEASAGMNRPNRSYNLGVYPVFQQVTPHAGFEGTINILIAVEAG